MYALQNDWVDMDATAYEHMLADPRPQERHLRNALGCFPTGVTVVTTVGEDGRLYGMTVSSFSSVSLDPPMVLWSQRLNAPSHAVFHRAQHFAINVLGDAQQCLSVQFARPAADKFRGVAYHLSPEGVPLLDDVAAQFVCRNDFSCKGGDHVVFFGRVIRFGYSPTTVPLVYARGAAWSGGPAQSFQMAVPAS